MTYTNGIQKILPAYMAVPLGDNLNNVFFVAEKSKYLAIEFNGDIYIREKIDSKDWFKSPFIIEDFET